MLGCRFTGATAVGLETREQLQQGQCCNASATLVHGTQVWGQSLGEMSAPLSSLSPSATLLMRAVGFATWKTKVPSLGSSFSPPFFPLFVKDQLDFFNGRQKNFYKGGRWEPNQDWVFVAQSLPGVFILTGA